MRSEEARRGLLPAKRPCIAGIFHDTTIGVTNLVVIDINELRKLFGRNTNSHIGSLAFQPSRQFDLLTDSLPDLRLDEEV